jgi:hypothetical protein
LNKTEQIKQIVNDTFQADDKATWRVSSVLYPTIVMQPLRGMAKHKALPGIATPGLIERAGLGR